MSSGKRFKSEMCYADRVWVHVEDTALGEFYGFYVHLYADGSLDTIQPECAGGFAKDGKVSSDELAVLNEAARLAQAAVRKAGKR